MQVRPGMANEPIERHAGRSVFGLNAAGYDTARSGYPQALFDLIARSCKADPRVLEIGAGTGLATEGLLTLSLSHLTAIEPDSAMAQVLARKLVGAPADIICAPFAEAVTQGDFDLVACAAAFHWLEPAAALAKIGDLLAEGGILAVWWNSYFGHGLDDRFGDRVSALLQELEVALPPSYRDRRHYAFDSAEHRATFAAGGFDVFEEAVFTAERELSSAQVRDLFATFSFVALLDTAKREVLLEKLGELVDGDFGGQAPTLHATAIYLSRVRS